MYNTIIFYLIITVFPFKNKDRRRGIYITSILLNGKRSSYNSEILYILFT